ncbi:hypothetical protein GCM10007315_20940 [Gemmobacter tilapiae]|uniref:Uncharacterized protein n=1 Tax=Neogemmobacter tilapiae TaxID=875041 RepID=A0A918TS53_9RHOB|nr:hypothetical protein GCM10007315_20940 [Gemmobacter tilapiae]
MIGHAIGNGLSDLVGVKVQFGGQALDIEMLPAVQADQRHHLMREGPAGDEEDAALAVGREACFGEGLIIGKHEGPGRRRRRSA